MYSFIEEQYTRYFRNLNFYEKYLKSKSILKYFLFINLYYQLIPIIIFVIFTKQRGKYHFVVFAFFSFLHRGRCCCCLWLYYTVSTALNPITLRLLGLFFLPLVNISTYPKKKNNTGRGRHPFGWRRHHFFFSLSPTSSVVTLFLISHSSSSPTCLRVSRSLLPTPILLLPALAPPLTFLASGRCSSALRPAGFLLPAGRMQWKHSDAIQAATSTH